jgi:hypothetical protein
MNHCLSISRRSWRKYRDVFTCLEKSGLDYLTEWIPPNSILPILCFCYRKETLGKVLFEITKNTFEGI